MKIKRNRITLLLKWDNKLNVLNEHKMSFLKGGCDTGGGEIAVEELELEVESWER